MLATQEPNRVYLTKSHGNRQQRQISRMIRHIRDQYHETNPLSAMPSSWLIEELVINASNTNNLEDLSWQQRVTLTLEQIIRDTAYDDCLYINSHSNLPLFPNNELFDPWEIHQIMKAFLAYLER